MSDGGRCVKHDNFHAHCQQCCRDELTSLRAEVERLKKLTDRPAWWTQVQRENDALRAEVERLRAKGEALAKAMRGGMHAAFAQGGESVECACSSCTNRRAALAEWEKP